MPPNLSLPAQAWHQGQDKEGTVGAAGQAQLAMPWGGEAVWLLPQALQ